MMAQVNTYSVENRTRKYQPFQSELPPEAFADLVFRRNIPPQRPSRATPIAPPAKSSITPWVIIALLRIILIGMVTRRQPSEASRVSIAAQPAATPIVATPQREIGARQLTAMPDGSTVPTTFKGYLSDVSQLPHHGAQIGDMWGIGHNLWVLTTPANSYRVGWVEPPGDESEVRRALAVDSVEVRRAKMVCAEGGIGTVARGLTSCPRVLPAFFLLLRGDTP